MLALVLGVFAGCADTGTSEDSGSPAVGQDGQTCGGPATDLGSTLKIITDPAGCPGGSNTFWRGQLGGAWTEPKIIGYHNGEVPAVACAPADSKPSDFANNALYCPSDDTLAYSVEFMADLAATNPDYPLFVLLHELGHRATHISSSEGAVSRAEENQADCLAGLQTKFADDAHRLNLLDAAGGALLFYQLGDTRGGWFDQEAMAPDAHGTPRQRAQAFAFGYFRDLGYCQKLGKSPTGSVPLI
jgi:predicted metalloprotease